MSNMDARIATRQTKLIGEFGNLWDGVVEENSNSKVVDTENLPHISIMIDAFEVVDGEKGDDSKNVTISFEASPDGEHFTFCQQITQNLPQGGDSRAHIFETVGARYIRLVRNDTSDGEAYIQATLQAKP